MSQTQSSNNNKRIAKNTLMLYFRMLFMMVVSLYMSRVILKALEVEDFGIYVVGGMVVMFAAILHINDIRRMGESKGHFYELLFALSLTPYVFLNNDNQKKMFYINQNN